MTDRAMTDFATDLTAIASVDGPSVRTAEFPVSAHAITTWCAEIGDDNPLYSPDRAADQVAPMAMLQTWSAPRTRAEKSNRPTVHAQVRKVAGAHGLTGIVATNYELDLHNDLKVNDVVTERCWVDQVSDLKSTALGAGHFVTIAFELTNQNHTAIGTVRARTFYYRPHRDERPAAPAPDRGDLESPEQIHLTRTMVVAGALASNDHEPVHHDHEVANGQGLPDIIVSIITTAGLVCAYGRREWGIDHPRHLAMRLSAPAFPGDDLILSGQQDENAKVTPGIRVRAEHARGLHASGVVAGVPASESSRAET